MKQLRVFLAATECCVVISIRNRLPEAIEGAKKVVSDELPAALKPRLVQITESMLKFV